jgi:CRP-like cAMP-binding protein
MRELAKNSGETKDLIQKFRDPQWGAGQLRRISIFGGLTDEELFDLYNLGRIRSLKPKAHAVIEGEPTRGLFILLHGTVSVYKTNKTNNSMFRLAFLEEGAAFGELSLFDSAPRSATVATESVCHLFYLDAESFDTYLERRGDNIKSRFYKRCAEDIVEKLRNQNADYVHSQLLLWQYGLKQPELDSSKEPGAKA